jgi:hypothetical protein
MLLIHMLALLVYSLLERQVRQEGLPLTTRRIIQHLESLEVIETVGWDGSHLYRPASTTPEQLALLHVLAKLGCPRWPHASLTTRQSLCLAMPPPDAWGMAG